MLENTTLLSILATVIIMSVLALVYFYFRLKTLLRQLDAQVYQLYFAYSRKADLLPIAIERLKIHNPSHSFAALIDARAATLKRGVFDEKKRQLEETLWQTYQTTAEESKNWPGISKDHLLSSVEKQLKDADLALERERENYNHLTVRYNKIIGNPLLKPAALAVRTGKRTIF